MAPRGEIPEVCKRLSSTPLEILFFLNGWYYATYFLLELFIFLYKGLLLPYPTANLVLDVVMLLLYLGIEAIRLFFAPKDTLWTAGLGKGGDTRPTSNTSNCARSNMRSEMLLCCRRNETKSKTL
nr:PREDICTED: transmembrane protein 216 isoform X5 [Rhinolophus sinicus]